MNRKKSLALALPKALDLRSEERRIAHQSGMRKNRTLRGFSGAIKFTQIA
jgi:hypothetical protein